MVDENFYIQFHKYNYSWLFKSIIVSVFIFLIVSGCSQAQPAKGASSSTFIGVWEVKGDSIIWRPNFETNINIDFVYLPPNEFYSAPRIKFNLADSAITQSDYKNLDIFSIEHKLIVPETFDLISSHSSSGFRSAINSFRYYSVHFVNCDKTSTTDMLTYKMVSGLDSKQNFKYVFETAGIGEAIKQIACK